MTLWRMAATGVLILAGVTLMTVNLRKLFSDWSRPKPVHNVDRAWIQVYLGLAMLAVAWVLIVRPAEKLAEPIPRMVNPDAAQQPSADASAGAVPKR